MQKPLVEVHLKDLKYFKKLLGLRIFQNHLFTCTYTLSRIFGKNIKGVSLIVLTTKITPQISSLHFIFRWKCNYFISPMFDCPSPMRFNIFIYTHWGSLIIYILPWARILCDKVIAPGTWSWGRWGIRMTYRRAYALSQNVATIV